VWNKGEIINSGIDHRPEALQALRRHLAVLLLILLFSAALFIHLLFLSSSLLHACGCCAHTLHPACRNPSLFTPQSVWNKGEMMYSGIDHRPEALRSLLKKFGFRLHEVMDAKDISRRYHPHVKGWSAVQPHVAPFFGYVAAEKVKRVFKMQQETCSCWLHLLHACRNASCGAFLWLRGS
jgi:hypothetical protein